MEDSFLLKIALILAIFGILLLYIISLSFTIPENNINNTKNMKDNEIIRIKGTITNVKELNKTLILDISQQNSIKAVFFKKSDSDSELKEGYSVDISGKIRIYNNKPEIVIDKLKIINKS